MSQQASSANTHVTDSQFAVATSDGALLIYERQGRWETMENPISGKISDVLAVDWLGERLGARRIRSAALKSDPE